jgi:hypothetical protein
MPIPSIPQTNAGSRMPNCGSPKNQMNSCTSSGVPRIAAT